MAEIVRCDECGTNHTKPSRTLRLSVRDFRFDFCGKACLSAWLKVNAEKLKAEQLNTTRAGEQSPTRS